MQYLMSFWHSRRGTLCIKYPSRCLLRLRNLFSIIVSSLLSIHDLSSLPPLHLLNPPLHLPLRHHKHPNNPINHLPHHFPLPFSLAVTQTFPNSHLPPHLDQTPSRSLHKTFHAPSRIHSLLIPRQREDTLQMLLQGIRLPKGLHKITLRRQRIE